MHNTSNRILLDLVSCSLGNIDHVDIPVDVNLQELRLLAKKQAVHGIAFDAINAHAVRQREWTVTETDVLMDWLWQTNVAESRYVKYTQAIGKLASVYQYHNLRMMLLKGYGCSLNYPVPNHRPCGDIDIWMFGKREEADRIAEKDLAVSVDSERGHHSQFRIKKFLVENHKTILDVRTHKSSIYLNNILETLAQECQSVEIDGSTVYIPSVKFNSIHLLRHMASDFATANITLRHILDWSTFVSANATAIDWEYVQSIARKTNMHRFLDAVNGICVHYLRYPSAQFPVIRSDDALRDRVLSEILYNDDTDERYLSTSLTFSQKVRYGIKKTIRLWHNRWKYRIVYDESLLHSFLSLSLNRIKN